MGSTRVYQGSIKEHKRAGEEHERAKIERKRAQREQIDKISPSAGAGGSRGRTEGAAREYGGAEREQINETGVSVRAGWQYP